jgi:hypothetical protein
VGVSVVGIVAGKVIATAHQSIIEGTNGLFITVAMKNYAPDGAELNDDALEDNWVEVAVDQDFADTIDLDDSVRLAGEMKFANGVFYLIGIEG